MDSENIYNIEEEDDNLNYAQSEPQDIPDDVQAEKSSAISILLKILGNPVNGWKELKRGKFKTDKIAANLFYPMLAMSALSEFTGLFYSHEDGFADIIPTALLTFITFFFGYFTILIFGGILLPKCCNKIFQTDFGKEYAMINITTLAMFYILYRVFPPAGPIIVFLPLWTVYIAYKGIKLFRIPFEKETLSGCIIIGLIIGCPLLWNWIFSDILKFV